MYKKVSVFKERLDAALQVRNMRPIDLAHKIHISEATISQYRSGYAEPKGDRLIEIANALDANPAWLMGLNVSMDVGKKETEAIEVLKEIKQEIEDKYSGCDICEYFEDYDYEENDISEYRSVGSISEIVTLIQNKIDAL